MRAVILFKSTEVFNFTVSQPEGLVYGDGWVLADPEELVYVIPLKVSQPDPGVAVR